MLKGKKILLGITGSISAYKGILLVRLLVKAGAHVKVILTPSAHEFVSELTLATLSKNPVLTKMVVEGDEGEKQWNNHVELGEWADLFLIAPASAQTISKMVTGTCDNLLMATFLSARCPVWYAPAMDLDMYKHPATKKNIEVLEKRGFRMIPPGKGELASGLVGEGRLAEPESIYGLVEAFFNPLTPLKGKRVLITAGPTYEYLDPVRFIGNPSTGKMGFALAEVAAARGAEVVLVSGPTALVPENQSIQLLRVTSAEEMHSVCESFRLNTDVGIMAAAVADFTPAVRFESKVKKGAADIVLKLQRTKDILAHWGKMKKIPQVLVGFAMETDDLLKNAKEKLSNKNANFIVLNSLREDGAGFAGETNKVTLVFADQEVELPLLSKKQVAEKILDEVESIIQSQK